MIVLAAALLPAIFLLVYTLRKDAWPEPKKELKKALLGGVLIIPAVCIVEGLVDQLLFGPGGSPSTYPGVMARAFFTAAIPEESFKLLALWLVLRKNPYFDEHYDGIVYAVCVGLSFAAFENVTYLFSAGDMWVPVAVSRALLAVPGHFFFAVLMGYYYSVYHFIDHSPRNKAYILLVPVFAHGIYDTIAMAAELNPYIGGLATIMIIWFVIKMHKHTKKKLLAMVEKDRNATMA